MQAIVVVLGYFAVAIFVIIKARNKSGRGNELARRSSDVSNSMPARQVTHVAGRSSSVKSTRPVSYTKSNADKGVNQSMVREERSFQAMEDRRGDWLAKQLDDEKIAGKRMSAMFQLHEEHQSQCEAELIRQFHSMNCDSDRVDTAEG